MGHLLGYARVSTTDQQPQLQVDALKAAGCYRVFTETASGARTDRPVLEQLLDQHCPGDTLVVWKLDRLGRSLRHLVDTVTGLADRGVGFRSLQEAIDTTTPRRQARLSRVRRPSRVRTRPDPGTHQRWVGRGPGSGPPRRPAIGDYGRQASGGSGAVWLWAVHSGDDRQDHRSQPGVGLPAPHRRHELTESSQRDLVGRGADHLTSCMPYGPAAPPRPIQLSSCGRRCPLGTVVDRC
jgi:Resolvase, N terminal domain